MEADRVLLCIPAGEESYGIDFPNVVELCRDFRISVMPCLREPYCGVSNYKGMMIPVVEFQAGEWERRGRKSDGCVLVVVRFQKYWLGILSYEKPYIMQPEEARRIQNSTGRGELDIWQEKELFESDGRICAVIDFEKTLERLILYP